MEGLFGDNKLGELEEKIDALVSSYKGIKGEKEKLAARIGSLEVENRELKQKMAEIQSEKEIVMRKVKSILEKVEKIEG
ncbi:MAG TPA: cell division protein ZapB [Syntrophorhabdales bacterium]|nr:cell division protein ZapB [Syntrophorhabdales bacterium]